MPAARSVASSLVQQGGAVTGEAPDRVLRARAGLLTNLHTLLDSWFGAAELNTPPATGTLPGQRATVFGLAAYVHGQGRLAVGHIEQGSADAYLVIPNVRGAYESALTAQWLVQVNGALHDWAREGARQSRALLNDVNQLDTAGEALEMRPDVAALLSASPGATDGAARRMAQRCLDLEGAGPLGYIEYRLLSAQAHASPDLVAPYLTNSPSSIATSMVPVHVSGHQVNELLHVLARSVIWAGLAADTYDPNHGRQDLLLTAAQKMRVPLLSESESSKQRRDAHTAQPSEKSGTGVEGKARDVTTRRGRREENRRNPKPEQ